VCVPVKAVVVVPHPTRWAGPWLGASRAAPLHRVANRPILWHVLEALLQAGASESVIVSPVELAEEIAESLEAESPPGTKIDHVTYDDEAGDADVLVALAERIGSARCVLHRADGLLGQPLRPVVGLTDTTADAVLLVGAPDDHGRLRLVPQNDHASPADSTLAPGATAAVCVLGSGHFASLAELGGPARPLDFVALVESLTRMGVEAEVRLARKWRRFAGEATDLLDLNRTVLDGLESDMTGATAGNRFEGHIAIEASASISSSVIIGPTVIGADAVIADSYIGPHTAIGERVHIEGAELERSIVLEDASVQYVGSRLVASVVGRGTRVFRDFSVPRALRLHVGDGDEVALC
jgi:glucose-1-phosphate thymidylyltransferase